MTNSQITLAARNHLQGNWITAILAFFIIAILPEIILYNFPVHYTLFKLENPNLQNIQISGAYPISIILHGGLAFGGCMFSISLIRHPKVEIEMIFSGFKELNLFLKLFLVHIITSIFIILQLFFFIIPGIIASLSYSMVYFVLIDDPEISVMDAITKSKLLMKGNKWQLFTLILRFIGLGILCILTLGIGFLWLIPYANVCLAQFYEGLVDEVNEDEIEYNRQDSEENPE